MILIWGKVETCIENTGSSRNGNGKNELSRKFMPLENVQIGVGSKGVRTPTTLICVNPKLFSFLGGGGGGGKG